MGPGGFSGGGSIAHRTDIPNHSVCSAYQLHLLDLKYSTVVSDVPLFMMSRNVQ